VAIYSRAAAAPLTARDAIPSVAGADAKSGAPQVQGALGK